MSFLARFHKLPVVRCYVLQAFTKKAQLEKVGDYENEDEEEGENDEQRAVYALQPAVEHQLYTIINEVCTGYIYICLTFTQTYTGIATGFSYCENTRGMYSGSRDYIQRLLACSPRPL